VVRLLKKEKHLNERKVPWKEFKGYFQEKYLFKNYYEIKMKEFFNIVT